MNREDLLNVFLDTQKCSDEETITAIENFISDCNPFNHSASSLEGAVCVKDFEKIGGKFEKILSKENIKKSERVQLLEKSFTKRELAILSLVAAMQASI